MLSSVGIQIFSCNQSLYLYPAKTSQIPSIRSHPNKKNLKPLTAAASSLSQQSENEKMKVVVKPIERPRLVLKFVWMEKNIGIAVDQLIPGGGGTIPVSPYYFWPRKDAWEELKVMLETKPWISDTQKVFLLNQATDIINLWQKPDT